MGNVLKINYRKPFADTKALLPNFPHKAITLIRVWTNIPFN